MMCDGLQIEQCQRIHARAMKKVADAASAPVYGSDRAGMTFSWWATAHTFQHRGGGDSQKTRRLQAEATTVVPSPESLKLISEAIDSVDVHTAGTRSEGSVAASTHVRCSSFFNSCMPLEAALILDTRSKSCEHASTWALA
jgi:hypothetical protein